jgi:hypothetical protein
MGTSNAPFPQHFTRSYLSHGAVLPVFFTAQARPTADFTPPLTPIQDLYCLGLSLGPAKSRGPLGIKYGCSPPLPLPSPTHKWGGGEGGGESDCKTFSKVCQKRSAGTIHTVPAKGPSKRGGDKGVGGLQTLGYY